MGALTKELTCVCCPLGCLLSARVKDGVPTDVSGNRCPRGDAYARSELVRPLRSVTTTVGLAGCAHATRLPVKTASAVPRECIADVMGALSQVRAIAPVRLGEVVLSNVAGTGVPVVATRSVDRSEAP